MTGIWHHTLKYNGTQLGLLIMAFSTDKLERQRMLPAREHDHWMTDTLTASASPPRVTQVTIHDLDELQHCHDNLSSKQ